MAIKTAQTDAAETQAIDILSFLAADPERLGRFLTLTGVDPSDIRRLMKEQGFWQAIFDHLLLTMKACYWPIVRNTKYNRQPLSVSDTASPAPMKRGSERPNRLFLIAT